MSKEVIIRYEAFIGGDDMDEKKKQAKIELEPSMGYLGKIDEARKLFERIYKS